jgi:hypothetical protein
MNCHMQGCFLTRNFMPLNNFRHIICLLLSFQILWLRGNLTKSCRLR